MDHKLPESYRGDIEDTVFPPIAAGDVSFFSEVSDPALIRDPEFIGGLGFPVLKTWHLLFSAISHT